MKYVEQDKSTAVLYFIGTISSWWNGANDFISTINDIQAKGYTNLTVKVHCYGGEVLEGTAIYNTIRQSSLNVTWDIIGICASMMTIVILSKGKIRMAANAYVMIHAPSGGAFGNAKDMFATGKALMNMQENFSKDYSKKMGKKPADVLYLMDGADHWFTADECLQMKYADEIIDAVDEVESNSKPDAGMDIEKVYNRYAAIAAKATTTPGQKQNQNSDMDKNAIIAAFGLTTVNAQSSDTAVMEALTASMREKDNKITQLNNQVTGLQTASIDAMISSREAAMNATFTPEQKTAFKTIGVANMDTLKTVLEAYKPQPAITNMLKPEAKTDGTVKTEAEKQQEARAAWTYKDWVKNDMAGLEAMAESTKPEDIAAFNKLYKAEFKVDPPATR